MLKKGPMPNKSPEGFKSSKKGLPNRVIRYSSMQLFLTIRIKTPGKSITMENLRKSSNSKSITIRKSSRSLRRVRKLNGASDF